MSRELTPDLIRRVLVATAFDNCESLFWRVDDGVLSIYATCSDFFAWGGSDAEPIETAADVELFEQAFRDASAAESDPYPTWASELYAARKRRQQPAEFMFAGYLGTSGPVADLFRACGQAHA